MDRRRDGAARRHRTSSDVKSRHRKMAHALTCALMRRRVDGSLQERGGACGAVFRRGCHRRVDRPRAPQNLRFLVGEELAEKSPTVARRSFCRLCGFCRL